MVDGQLTSMQSCCTTSPRTSMNGIKFDCRSYGTGSKQLQDLRSYLIWREKGNLQKLQNMKLINGVSKNGKSKVKARSSTSMFDARHIHMLHRLQTKSMWQHQQQWRCLNLADHVQKVLQQTTCLRPQRCASTQTDSYEDDRKARMNDQGLYLRVKSNRDIDWSKPLWEQLAPVLKGGPSPGKSQDELRAARAKVPELTNVLFQWYLSSRQCHHSSTEESWCSQDPHVRTCSMGPSMETHWFSLLIATADDDCHMVPQLGGCEQVAILDADIASSLW